MSPSDRPFPAKLIKVLSAALLALAGILFLGREALTPILTDDVLSEHWLARAPVLLAVSAVVIFALQLGLPWITAHVQLAPPETDREAYGRMFLLSACALLLELALIRWVGSEVRAFAYFKNFILISAFLGFGLGMALGPRATRLFPAALIGLTVITLLVYLWNDASVYPALSGQEQTWGHQVATRKPVKLVFMLGFFLFSLISFFAAICGTFAALTQELGSLFGRLPRIPAYSTNLAGSLAGVLAFNALSWAETTPVVWFAMGIIPLGILCTSARLRWLWGITTVITLSLAIATDARESGADVEHNWSPYYRVSIARVGRLDALANQGAMAPTPTRYTISVNRSIMTMTHIMSSSHYEGLYGQPKPESTYSIPFWLLPNVREVLVLAVGGGNDVAAALGSANPERVVAVELDPEIARYSRLLHPDEPLSDPRTELIIDDARHYVETTEDTFDLVLMSFLDSHTLLSAYSQLRTDNFLYTKEAFAKVRTRLKPGGVFVVTYATNRYWLVARLVAALRAAFDMEPLVVDNKTGYVFCAVGPGLKDATIPESLQHWLDTNPFPPVPPDQSYPTDDRPFLTLAEGKLPTTYWISIVAVILLTSLALRVAQFPVRRLDPLFLLLGAGFLLAETRLITVAGLLFGVTWHAYGVVISVVLLTLIGGTLLAGRFKVKRVWTVYPVLLAAIVLSQVVPTEALTATGPAMRILLAIVVFGPTFLVASYAFAAEFDRTPAEKVPVALSSNLIGSVAGGLLEYQAVGLGIGSLAFTALGLYALAALASRRR